MPEIRLDAPLSASDRPILVTGAAGFIGYHLSQRLLTGGNAVVGIDNLNPYYDPGLKSARLDRLRTAKGFHFTEIDLADRDAMRRIFSETRPGIVVNLAAQAGVRYSIENPQAYGEANLTGFLNLLECCRHGEVEHLVYASSSSVYGGNSKTPFSVNDSVDHPVSLYAATKKSGELMAHSYSHLYGIPSTGLRFFTVYGPWGRPDMAYWKFTEAILQGRPIEIYNNGHMARDFTYIDDIIEGVVRVMARPPAPDPDFDRMNPDPARSWAPYRVFNIGNTQREALMDMIAILEDLTGREAIREFRPMQPGDVVETWADIAALTELTGFHPTTSLSDGLAEFVTWYRGYNAR